MGCGRVEGKKVEDQWVEGALNESVDEYGTWEEFCCVGDRRKYIEGEKIKVGEFSTRSNTSVLTSTIRSILKSSSFANQHKETIIF